MGCDGQIYWVELQHWDCKQLQTRLKIQANTGIVVRSGWNRCSRDQIG